ncbi:hypothetical protein FWH58_01185 [Candidatus Saccharibacteria bacterium]|nr:hypothetical protein [Candidatus Saccharibacteria bacterium]
MTRFRKLLKSYKKNKKMSVVIIYVVLRTLVIACVILQSLRGEFENAFLCLCYLVLLTLPITLQDKFKMELPSLLEIIIYLFIFSGTILGGIFNFYGRIPEWDIILHAISGFICAGIGFALVDLMNENSKQVQLSPFYMAFMAFCFSMAAGVCWEFFEYGADKLALTDMQKDTITRTISTVELNPAKNNKPLIIKNIDKTILYNKNGAELAVVEGGYLDIGLNDTMKDLIFNFAGAIVFSILGYFYIKNEDKYKFTNNFIPKRAEKRE